MTMGTLTQHIYPETEQMTHAEPTQSLSWRDCEIELAREVQNRTFPLTRPRIAGLDYYSDWRPARGLSGDYLDFFELPEGNLGLAIGDVAGERFGRGAAHFVATRIGACFAPAPARESFRLDCGDRRTVL